MSKYNKLNSSATNFHKMALVKYLAAKLSLASVRKVADAGILSEAEDILYKIKDEDLSTQFELYVETYKNILGALKGDMEIGADVDLQDSYAGLTKQVKKFSQNPYLSLSSETDSWQEDFDPSEFIDSVRAIYLDAGQKMQDYSQGEIDLEEFGEESAPGEFTDQRVDKSDKSNSGLTWTGNKTEQNREAHEKRQQKVNLWRKWRDANKLVPGGEADIYFQNLSARHKAEWADLVANPEAMKAHRAKASPRALKHKQFDKRREPLLRLLELTRDPDEKAVILSKIQQIDSSAKKTQISQKNDVQRKTELLEYAKSEVDGPKKLEGLVRKLTIVTNDQKQNIKNDYADMIAEGNLSDKIKALAELKSSGDKAATKAAKAELSLLKKIEIEKIKETIAQHFAVLQYDEDVKPLQSLRNALQGLAKKQVLFPLVDEYIPVIDNLIEESKEMIGSLGAKPEFNKSIVALSTIVDYLESKIGKKKSSTPIYFTIKTAAVDVNVDEVIAYVDSLGIKDPMKYARTIAKTIMDALSGK